MFQQHRFRHHLFQQGLLLLSLSTAAWACPGQMVQFPASPTVRLLTQSANKATIEITGQATQLVWPDGLFLTFQIQGTGVSASGSIMAVGLAQGSGMPFTVEAPVSVLGTGKQTFTLRVTENCPPFIGTTYLLTIEFELGATVGSGRLTSAETNSGAAGDPFSTLTGEVYGFDSARELLLPGPLPVFFQRYYGSLLSDGVLSSLGRNWMHNYDLRLIEDGDEVTVVMFRGKQVSFARQGQGWESLAEEGWRYQLVDLPSGGHRFMDPTAGPARERIYTFNDQGDLTAVSDRNGNTLTVTQGLSGPTRVSDGMGRTLTLTYQSGVLSRVSDSAGRNIRFEHSGDLLTAWVDAEGARTVFDYADGAISEGLLEAQQRPRGNQPLRQVFDAQGRVASQTDSAGNRLTVTYDEETRGATVTGPLGFTMTHEHDQAGNLIRQVDPNGAEILYRYDGRNRLVGITDRMGAERTILWDSTSGLPRTVTDESGNATAFTYTERRQDGFTFYDLASATFSDGTGMQFGRNARGSLTLLTDAAGSQWQWTYNERGQVLTERNPSSGISTFQYANDGTLVAITAPSGEKTTVLANAAGQLAQVTNPDNSTFLFHYNLAGNLDRATDERVKIWWLDYSANQMVSGARDPLGNGSQILYNGQDGVERITDPNGNATEVTYDALNRPSVAVAPEGERLQWSYDVGGRVRSLTDGSGAGFTFAWDAENRPVRVTDAANRSLTMTRDMAGRVTSLTRADGAGYSFEYNRLGRLLRRNDPGGGGATYRYGPGGRLMGVDLGGGVAASFTLNTLGRVTGIIDAAGRNWMRSYDSSGRLIRRTDPLNRATSYTYDQRQRLLSATTGTGTVNFAYDVTGNLTRRTFSDFTRLDYRYDDAGRLTSGTGFAFGYDASGRLTSSNGLAIGRDGNGRIESVTYGAGKQVTYEYNARGLLETVTDWVGGRTTFAYNAARELVGVNFANSIAEAFTYDANGLPASMTVRRGSDTVASIQLTRDVTGRVTSAERAVPAIPEPANGTLALAYDAAAQVNGSSYDGAGRLTGNSLRSFTWDVTNLTSYQGEDGGAAHEYDGLRQRIKRSSGGVAREYVWNYATPLPTVAIEREGGADTAYYIWLPSGVLLARIGADGVRTFYHYDESGSTMFLTGAGGQLTDTYAITPYGESVEHAGVTANPFTFHGAWGVEQEGDTGLYYMRSRYYDAATARFLSPDPAETLDPRAVNPYQYAFNDPVANADPAGMFPGAAGSAWQRQLPVEVPQEGSDVARLLFIDPNVVIDPGDDFVATFAAAFGGFGGAFNGLNQVVWRRERSLRPRPVKVGLPVESGRFNIGFEAVQLNSACDSSGADCALPACDSGGLCLGGDRFRVKGEFATPDPQQAAHGPALPFFQPGNTELLVKVLDGCGPANQFWFFAGGLTNVEYGLTVTDSTTGQLRTYGAGSGAGAFVPGLDSNAFSSCP